MEFQLKKNGRKILTNDRLYRSTIYRFQLNSQSFPEHAARILAKGDLLRLGGAGGLLGSDCVEAAEEEVQAVLELAEAWRGAG